MRRAACRLLVILNGIINRRCDVVVVGVACDKKGKHRGNQAGCQLRVQIPLKLLHLLDHRCHHRHTAILLRSVRHINVKYIRHAGVLSIGFNTGVFDLSCVRFVQRMAAGKVISDYAPRVAFHLHAVYNARVPAVRVLACALSVAVRRTHSVRFQ